MPDTRPASAAVIALEGVTKRYGGVCALDRVDLRLAPAQTTVLLGTSGCGKSTLLRIVLRLVRPDAGRVLFHGRPAEEHEILELRRRLGYVIQEGGLFPHLTVSGNVGLVPRHLGWPADRVRARIEELAERARLPRSLLERYPLELSGGQRQRVGLMRALALDPEILLFDEPLAALDPITRADLQEELREGFRRWGKTVVWVTHDLSEAAYFADRVVLLRAGRIVQEGAFRDLLQRPADAYVERFVRAQRTDWSVA